MQKGWQRMGMTIDEAIEILQERDKCMEYVTDNDSEAFKTAIDTMRKYQEIRKIYMTHHYTDEEVIEKIKEVIKWG